MRRMMMWLLAVVALAGCATAATKPELEYRNDRGLVIRLTHGQCRYEAFMKEMMPIVAPSGRARAALISVNGMVTRGCWVIDEDGDLFVADERGRAGFLPIHEFKQVAPVGVTLGSVVADHFEVERVGLASQQLDAAFGRQVIPQPVEIAELLACRAQHGLAHRLLDDCVPARRAAKFLQVFQHHLDLLCGNAQCSRARPPSV